MSLELQRVWPETEKATAKKKPLWVKVNQAFDSVSCFFLNDSLDPGAPCGHHVYTAWPEMYMHVKQKETVF